MAGAVVTLEPPLGELVVVGCRLMPARTDRGGALSLPTAVHCAARDEKSRAEEMAFDLTLIHRRAANHPWAVCLEVRSRRIDYARFALRRCLRNSRNTRSNSGSSE